MNVTGQELKNTPLFNKHVEAGARMVPFSGWNMPVQYTGIIDEHLHTRNKASIFDICHMGEFFLQGPGADRTLSRLVTCRIDDMHDGKCRYGFLLNQNGGIVDDLIVFRISPEEYMLVVNAGTIGKDREWIVSNIPANIDFSDRSEDIAKIDIQGPLSGKVLEELIDKKIIGSIKRYWFRKVDLDGVEILLSRTGYTGELGYELFFSKEHVEHIWDKLDSFNDVIPNGLGARDTLRLEMGYSLYGSDIDERHTPFESNLSRFVHMDKGFIGKEALLRQRYDGLSRMIDGINCEGRRSASGHITEMSGESIIGEVTSGAFSPCLKKGIGLAYMDKTCIIHKNGIILTDGKVEIPAEVSSIPLYKGKIQK